MTRLQQMLSWLERHRDHDVIKIVTGVRGCGKSELLDRYAAWLKKSGIPEDRILQIEFECASTRHLHTPEDLMDMIEEKSPKNTSEKIYLLLDEICELQEFDVALGTLFAMKHYDIVATCSNSRPVSERFGEYLSGRYVNIQMLTPSFREIASLKKSGSFNQQLEDFMKYGALPYSVTLRDKQHDAEIYLMGLWNTILVKDILTRNRMSDSRFTERLLERIYEHLGETESLRKISADAKIEGHEAAPNTVFAYIEALHESLLVMRVPRYDAFLGEKMKIGYRFYLADMALGRMRYGDFPGDPSNAVRNVIYLELLGRGNPVYAGRYDDEDFDFITIENKRVHCWQYAPKTINGRIPAAVLGPFKRIPGDMPKTVIAHEGCPKKKVEGINFITLENFLMGKDKSK